uniref:HECT-type E3 ubiquitin transferase n=1 Tax=Globisporangium ultimum (strain ATCC 200006 / CBS 805.95 / DAOM BR144) TaxID=431595 RepID=K3X469_GLOUD
MKETFVGLLVGFAVCWVLLVVCVRRSHRERLRDEALHAPLLDSNEHRLDAALRGAEDGYKACALCGFENFKRFQFCNICGEQLVQDDDVDDANGASDSATEQRPKAASPHTTTTTTTTRSPREQAVVTQRQKRAKNRKEWVRKLGFDGELFWYREGLKSLDSPFPGFALQYKGEEPPLLEKRRRDDDAFADTDTTCASEFDRASLTVVVVPSAASAPVEHALLPISGSSNDSASSRSRASVSSMAHENQLDGGESETDRFMRVGKEKCERELQDAMSSIQLHLLPALTADPAHLPLPVNTTNAGLQWRDILSLSSQVFPKKYAHFVTTTAALIVSSENLKISVNRDYLFEDSMDAICVLPIENILTAIRIHFFNEAGIDAGGLHREWFMLVNEQLVDPDRGLFRCVNKDEQSFYLNGNSQYDAGEHHLRYYYASGRLVGRALLEGYVLGFHLALPLLKMILGLPISFRDLEFFDLELYRNLLWLLENDGAEALGLDFSITETHGDNGAVVVDLIPDGRHIDVTDENKHEYVERRFRYLLFESVSSQLYVFLKGIYEVIPQELLMLFDPEEFDYLLCGSDEIDVDDWERNTRYTVGLHGHQAVVWFWELVREMPNEYRRRLLHFATGSSRVPIAGFSALTSYDGRLCPFTLKGVRLVKDGYIVSHACFNRLDLPLHVDRNQLKAVLQATVETKMYGFTTH